MICLAKVNQFPNLFRDIWILLTEALMKDSIGKAGRRFATLDGLPDTPATNIVNFRVGKILHFMPFEYGYTDLFTQILDIKHFAEEDISGAVIEVNRNESANDGYTFGQHGKVYKISLDTLSET